MLKKIPDIKTPLRKNRYLLAACFLLMLGMSTGCFAVTIFPDNLKENLLSMMSFETENIYYSFSDNFIFPFAAFTAVFLSGFSAAGHLTVFFDMLISGIYIGTKNTILLLDCGELFGETYLKYNFAYQIFICFMLIILAESAFFLSATVFSKLRGKDTAKQHYQAKYLIVKYFIFTAVSAVVSLFFRLS